MVENSCTCILELNGGFLMLKTKTNEVSVNKLIKLDFIGRHFILRKIYKSPVKIFDAYITKEELIYTSDFCAACTIFDEEATRYREFETIPYGSDDPELITCNLYAMVLVVLGSQIGMATIPHLKPAAGDTTEVIWDAARLQQDRYYTQLARFWFHPNVKITKCEELHEECCDTCSDGEEDSQTGKPD